MSTPKNTRKSGNFRSPRSTSKSDVLGKNKTQKTLLQYFESKPTITGNRREDTTASAVLDPSPVIVISDEEGVTVTTMENFLGKTKRKFSLSTKGCKTKGELQPRSGESEGGLRESEFKGDSRVQSIQPGETKSSSQNSRKRKSVPSAQVSAEKKNKENRFLERATAADAAIVTELSPPKTVSRRLLFEEGVKVTSTVGEKCEAQVLTTVKVENASCEPSARVDNLSPSSKMIVNVKREKTSPPPVPQSFTEVDLEIVSSVEWSELMESESFPTKRGCVSIESSERSRSISTVSVIPPAIIKKEPVSEAIDREIVENVDWTEPMEAEIIHSSPVKVKLEPVSSVETSASNGVGQQGYDGAKQATSSLDVATPKKTEVSSLLERDASTPAKAAISTKYESSPAKKPDHVVPSTSTSSTPSKLTPKKRTPKKGFPQKMNVDADNSSLLLVHCIKDCRRYASTAFLLNAYNEKVANDYLGLDQPEQVVLFKLISRKWSWIREIDMKYDKIAHDQVKSLKILIDKGFLETMTVREDLSDILDVLKRPELVELCKTFKVDGTGTKKESVERLIKFATSQGFLNFGSKSLSSKMKSEAFNKVGSCVRVAAEPREAFRRIFEASMSPLYLDGKYYTFQERLHGMESLMKLVKFEGWKLVPFKLSDMQLFKTTAQFEEYVASVVLKFDLLSAKDKRNFDEGVKLAQEARASLLIYVSSEAVRQFLNDTPRYLWRYTAGSNYASALDASIELFKKTKNYYDAAVALDVLLGQELFRKHSRGTWYAEKALVMDKYLNRPASEVFDVVVKGLREELTLIGRLELSKKALGLLKKRKNGLTDEQKAEIKRLARQPTLCHQVREIRGIEAPNMSSGKRQTYVELSSTGERDYFNVEQTARNAYMGEYPEGLHDEGKFVKQIILAAFWKVIYSEKDGAFVSKYQNAPLDWGTRSFHSNRSNEIKAHVEHLRSNGVDGIVEEIKTVALTYSRHHSLVDWSLISAEMLPTIKNILICLTLDKFFLLSDYLLQSFRERRSGWPDLTLWNTVAGKFKFVEVKSTNDELSLKQIVWLAKLSEMGIDVEECRVNAAQKGKRKMTDTPMCTDASQEVL